jgi:type I restriction enzyme, S subunit
VSRWPIPKTWEWVSAGQLFDIVGGGTPPSKYPGNFATRGIPWLTPADLSGYEGIYIERGARDLSERGYTACGARLLPKGTVLYTSRAPIGYCVIAANEICTNQGFKSLVLFSDTSPEYIRYYLLASKEYAESLASGSTFLELSGRRMSELMVPLAGSKEQRRIADKITTLDTHSRAARKHLDAIPPLQEQFRASVLSAAFSGRLTADWRAEQKRKGVKIETADALLERMRIERRQRWEVDQLARMKAKGQKPKDDTWKKKYKEPEPLDATGLPELPMGWCWTTVECVSHRVTDGTHQPPPFAKTGIPFLVIGNVKDGKVDWQSVSKWVTRETFERFTSRVRPSRGDVMYTAVGSYGTAIEVETDQPFMFQRHIAHIKPVALGCQPAYLTVVLNAPQTRQLADRVARGVAQKTVTLGDLSLFPVPLPPVLEQLESKRLVAAYFENLEKIDTELNSVDNEHVTLTQSILAKAFRGELVPQDPNDEPATELLKRITEEKEKMKTAKQETPRKGCRRGK